MQIIRAMAHWYWKVDSCTNDLQLRWKQKAIDFLMKNGLIDMYKWHSRQAKESSYVLETSKQSWAAVINERQIWKYTLIELWKTRLAADDRVKSFRYWSIIAGAAVYLTVAMIWQMYDVNITPINFCEVPVGKPLIYRCPHIWNHMKEVFWKYRLAKMNV